MKSVLPQFLLRILKGVSPSEEGTGIMSIVIRQPYAHLEKELTKTFERQEDVKVIVDRRYSEQRTSQQPVEVEQRHADRRQPKHEIVDVVLST